MAERSPPHELTGPLLAFAVFAFTTGAIALAPAAYLLLLLQYALAHFSGFPIMAGIGLAFFALVQGRDVLDLLCARIAGALGIVLTFCIGIAAFSAYKHHLPQLVPFFADAHLARWDAALHGADPWWLAHAILPSWADAPLAFLYGPAWFTLWLGTLLFVAFLPDAGLRARYLIAFALTLFLLGTIGRLAGSSAGPIFFDRLFGGDRFAGLISVLGEHEGGRGALGGAQYLWASYRLDGAVFGAGISAMPSIHVAMAVLNALFLSSLHSCLGALGWAFASAILFGSVYFGWHYALDGYVSLAGVLLIWWLADRLTTRREKTQRPAIGSSAVWSGSR